MYGVVYISVTQIRTENPSFNVDTQIEILSALFKMKHVPGQIRLANNALILSTVQIRYLMKRRSGGIKSAEIIILLFRFMLCKHYDASR